MRVLFRSDADVLPAVQNLWGCWNLLASARAARAPLDLDLPERQVILDAKGGIAEIRVRERLDAHRLIEDYMLAANVAPVQALEAEISTVMYCITKPPRPEKPVNIKHLQPTRKEEPTEGN